MKSPYLKAIVAGVLSAVVVAATVVENPYITIAAAACSPLAVYMARNTVVDE